MLKYTTARVMFGGRKSGRNDGDDNDNGDSHYDNINMVVLTSKKKRENIRTK